MRPTFIFALFCLTVSFSAAQAQVSHDARDGEHRIEARAHFQLSEINEQILKEFNEAWQQSALGTKDTEAVVLVLREPHGSIKAVSGGRTNQSYKFSFTWNPAIIAIVHTHPNSRDPRPSTGDIQIARTFNVPMFTITLKGMFMYDPAADKIAKIKSGVDWCDSSSWRRDSQLATSKPSRQ
jgi:hypothetical protein